MSRILLGLALLAGLGRCVAAAEVPDYDKPAWKKLTPQHYAAALASAAKPGGTLYLYLRQGEYAVRNPIVIERSLFLHGSSQAVTRLSPTDPTQPMFVVPGAHKLSIAGVQLGAARPGSAIEPSRTCGVADGCGHGCPCSPAPQPWPLHFPNQVAIRFEDCDDCRGAVRLEMHDAWLRHTSLRIGGAGTYFLQATNVTGFGHVRAPIVVDHPLARFVHVGGEYVNAPFRAPPWPEQVRGPFYHVWQKRGRVELYGVLPTSTFGNADFRFDTAATDGPHVVAGVRSEGINDSLVPYASSLVYVPPSREPVDVLLMASTGGFNTGATSHFIDYNAAGTVWLLGNEGADDVSRLAVGRAPGATVVALGNVIQSPFVLPGPREVSARSIEAGTKITAGNLYDRANFSRCLGPDCATVSNPRFRFVEPTAMLSDYPSIPRVPVVGPPPPLVRPRVGAALPGMIDVTDCGANPDPDTPGDADQTAIERAFEFAATGVAPPNCRDLRRSCACDFEPDQGLVFFPAGTYDLSRPLVWDFENRTSRPWSVAWIAGSGGDCAASGRCTLLRNVRDRAVPDDQQGVMYIASMVSSTLQGLHFQGPAYAAVDDVEQSDVATVQLEYSKRSEPGRTVGLATQSVSFHDCVFDGGKYALGVALVSQIQTDKVMVVASQFKNAKVGYAQTGHNALGNVIYDLGGTGRPTFENNEFALGHADVNCGGEEQVPCCLSPMGPRESLGAAASWCSDPAPGDRAFPCVPVAGTCNPRVPTAACGPGGSFHVLGATIRGTGTADLRSASSNPLFFHRLDTDTEVTQNHCDPGSSGAAGILFFHRSSFAHTDPARPMFDWRMGGGPFFLQATAKPGFAAPIFHANPLSPAFAFNLDAVDGARLWRGLRQAWASDRHSSRLYERHFVPCDAEHGCADDPADCIEVSCESESTATAYCWQHPVCADGTDHTIDDCQPCDPEDPCVASQTMWCINASGPLVSTDLLASYTAHEFSAFHDLESDPGPPVDPRGAPAVGACGGEWCDAPACSGVDSGRQACASSSGVVLGCPRGQSVHEAPCACDGSPGRSWFCEAARAPQR